MAKSLVIVESPAKAKTIKKFLGRDFLVRASIGHIKDLPKSRLGIDIDHGFKPEYVTIKGKRKIISAIKKDAQYSEDIYLASDPDREGEAIAWHIAQELVPDKRKIYRVLFNEITERSVLNAIKNPSKLNRSKFESQQARRILDRLVGYEISPLLWKKVRRGLSAGRVQSVALKLICEREDEIKSFVPEEYWSIKAEFKDGDTDAKFSAKLARKNNKKIKIKKREEAYAILDDLKEARFTVSDVEKKERKKKPSPPFITSSLQQEAARKLGFSAKRTMLIAQHLYEGVELGKDGSIGLITYMRTDSTRVSEHIIKEVREFIESGYGKDYLPLKPNTYPNKKGAQGAHEAIRPTNIRFTPVYVKEYLDKDHYELYNLIWKRFIASQMNPSLIEQTSIHIDAEISRGKREKYQFVANGFVIKFDGFSRVYVEGRDETGREEADEGILPKLARGCPLILVSIEPKQHFTQPPPRFTEASLVKLLEENGIGRPSTYANILSTIEERGYVKKESKRFLPTELGLLVTRLLVNSFPQIMDVGFTANMEEELDKVEEGELPWFNVVKDFYKPFKELLDVASIKMKDIKKEETPTDIRCEKCGSVMVIKWGKRGKFLACSGFPECRNTKEFIVGQDGEIKVLEVKGTGERCPKCGNKMVIKTGKFGRFLSCSKYPECRTVRSLSTKVGCPMEGCNGELLERRSKKGKVFYGCSNYPKCTFATWHRPLDEKCPECGNPILVEKATKGGIIVKSCLKKGCGFKEEVE